MLSEATSGLSRSAGCSRSSMLMVGAPPVVRLTTTSEAALIFGRNCLNTAGSCVGLPSFGLRACRCTIAAPACAAPIAAAAISSGVIGRCGGMLGVWIEPVTAHVMMTLPWAAAIVVLPEGGILARLQLEAAVHHQVLAGDEARFFRGEEKRRVGDVLRLGEA